MDQLRSGVRKVIRYVGVYANGKEAQFIEGDMFRTIIPPRRAADERGDRPQSRRAGGRLDQ
ncbi:hypothetical protein [uncultured Fibrella sp.]|uniref:hypothetical protein n=1 Tax=uncultured Fibrella sp. TaxID=1284596 RepID=UPI0035C94CF0